MAKLFDYNNPVWRFMGKVADMFFLTVLWAVFSLPIITVGASTKALYYVTLKMAGGKEGYLWQYFFQAFKEGLGQSVAVWLILLTIGLFFGWDLYYYYHLRFPAAVVVFWLFFVLSIFYLFVLTMAFPLAARLEAGVKKLFFLSFMVSLKNFSWVMLMIVAAVCIIAVGVFVFWPVLLFSAGTIAFVNSLILEKVIFPRYGWEKIENAGGE